MHRRSAWPDRDHDDDHDDAAPPGSSSRPTPSSPQDRLPPQRQHLQLPPQGVARAAFWREPDSQLHAGELKGLDLRKAHTRVSTTAACLPVDSLCTCRLASFIH
ncbi:hypothetical protein EUGRSUZ_G02366 [Eucalyptus grandis]|uniref:Uncharacterized protein n=2 Tax=Eucalyptus grandis TaxID=71139 RepID=A0ACC3K8C2_EUCGR|nr:hypothetical protein EUGRSUZ_G02366 [Eucalyptus grandis]